MSDLMEHILAKLSQEVKENMETLMDNNVINVSPEIPRFLNDPQIQHLPIELPQKQNYREQLTHIGQINRAYERLLTKGKENALSDSFRSEQIEETESRTARSFKTTLASFTGYMSILHATA